jgi:hypothetical protein
MKFKIVSMSSTLPSLVVLGCLTLCLSACNDNHVAEKAGAKVDTALTETREALNKAAAKTGAGLQKAGEKLEDAADGTEDEPK